MKTKLFAALLGLGLAGSDGSWAGSTNSFNGSSFSNGTW